MYYKVLTCCMTNMRASALLCLCLLGTTHCVIGQSLLCTNCSITDGFLEFRNCNDRIIGMDCTTVVRTLAQVRTDLGCGGSIFANEDPPCDPDYKWEHSLSKSKDKCYADMKQSICSIAFTTHKRRKLHFVG